MRAYCRQLQYEAFKDIPPYSIKELKYQAESKEMLKAYHDYNKHLLRSRAIYVRSLRAQHHLTVMLDINMSFVSADTITTKVKQANQQITKNEH